MEPERVDITIWPKEGRIAGHWHENADGSDEPRPMDDLGGLHEPHAIIEAAINELEPGIGFDWATWIMDKLVAAGWPPTRTAFPEWPGAPTLFCEPCGLQIRCHPALPPEGVAAVHREHGNGSQGVWLVPEGDTCRDETRIG